MLKILNYSFTKVTEKLTIKLNVDRTRKTLMNWLLINKNLYNISEFYMNGNV